MMHDCKEVEVLEFHSGELKQYDVAGFEVAPTGCLWLFEKFVGHHGPVDRPKLVYAPGTWSQLEVVKR